MQEAYYRVTLSPRSVSVLHNFAFFPLFLSLSGAHCVDVRLAEASRPR